MRTSNLIAAATLVACLSGCGEDRTDQLAPPEPPPATVTVTATPSLEVQAQPVALTFAQACEAYADSFGYVDIENHASIFDHLDRMAAVTTGDDPALARIFDPLHEAYLRVVDTSSDQDMAAIKALGRLMVLEDKRLNTCPG